MTNEFYILIRSVWNRDTSYLNVWIDANHALGQCVVTVLLFQDYFCGDIYKIKVDNVSHYFNVIEGKIYDLTQNQFKGKKINYEDKVKKDRWEILENKDTLKHYNRLKENYQQVCA